MAKKPKKTNAIRIVEQLGLEYSLAEYDIDMDDFTAEAVADLIGMPASAVFKTLVATGDRNGPCFAVVAADGELDLKRLAVAHGERSVAMVPVKDIEPLTGYRRGGVTAIGARKQLPVYLNESALRHKRIGVSAGTKGVQLLMAPDDYVVATGATVCPVQR